MRSGNIRDPDNFKDQVATLMDNHDGMSMILEHFAITSDEAAKNMIEAFLKRVQTDEVLTQKLKRLEK